jgi:cell division septation protein DedD
MHRTPGPPLPVPTSVAWLTVFMALAVAAALAPLLRLPVVASWLSRQSTRVWLRVEPFWLRTRRFLNRPVVLPARHEPKRRGLAHHHHTGKLIAHHHTSYASLAFLIGLASVLAAGVSYSSHAESSLLSLQVDGPPPAFSATIDEPVNGAVFTTSTQTVRGSCPSGLFVELWRNGAFAGSTICDINGLYAVVITLVPGSNNLVARDRDALGQYGPDSAVTTVTYNPPAPTPTPTPSAAPTPAATPAATATPAPTAAPAHSSPSPTPAPPGALLLQSDRRNYQGAGPGESVEWTMQVGGGTTPYAVTWNWGDGHTDSLSVGAAGPFTLHHQYDQPGIYQIIVRAKDAAGREAALQVVAVIGGGTSPATIGTNDRPGNLVFVWPLLVLLSVIVGSFWLGERHEDALMRPFIHQRA